MITTFEQSVVARLQFFSAVTSVASCVYLAYLLAFVLHDFCIVCVSTYVINGFLVYFTWKKTTILALKNK
ncbi:putative Vitamin K epoxide reductase complex subunit [Operophtera brumata]|uniref:vitamin-K-epoxide reductase (warfarin-sensitive) n=1 Tax=Operophtera brumata TaxID=104452 RepID=A0A0L7LVE5_OPEBR|nr:putative Vitamin K epoxide reductase complex subunit [Operophtera brumata]